MDNPDFPIAARLRLLRTRRALRDWRLEVARSEVLAEASRRGTTPDLMVLADTHALSELLAEECVAIAQIGLAETPSTRSSQSALAAELAGLAREARNCYLLMREALLRPEKLG